MFNTAQLNRIEKKLDVLLVRSAPKLPTDGLRLPIGLPFRVSELTKVVAKKRGRPFKNACDLCSFKGKNKRSLGAHKRFNHKNV